MFRHGSAFFTPMASPDFPGASRCSTLFPTQPELPMLIVTRVNLTCAKGKRRSLLTTGCSIKVSLTTRGHARTREPVVADHALLVENRADHFGRGKDRLLLARHPPTANQTWNKRYHAHEE